MADTQRVEEGITMTRIYLALVFSMVWVHAVCSADTRTGNDTAPNPPTNASALKPVMKIRLKIQDKVLTATLVDSKTTRDFVSLLPLTLTMKDLFGREKFAHLPRAISEEGKRTHNYEIGQVAYWSPGPDVAVFYRNDGEKIPNPGIIIIGKIDSGVEALDLVGSIKVAVELVSPP